MFYLKHCMSMMTLQQSELDTSWYQSNTNRLLKSLWSHALLSKTCGANFSLVAILPVEADDPCEPNPCGSYSNPPARRNTRCDCSCLPGMTGFPPNCRPECLHNIDCPTDKACKNQKCVDPCPGLCGRNANCIVRNHNPYCVCQNGFVGDPFSSCQKPSKFKMI